MSLAIGLDIGTTSTIAVLMDSKGAIKGVASRRTQLSSPRPGHAEQDPNEWWRNSCGVLSEIMGRLPNGETVSGLCVTGMLPAVVLLDAEGRVLRPSIQQSDARCGEQVEELRAELDEKRFLERTGQGLTQQLVAPKLRWLAKHEPDVFSRIATVFGSYDYINWRLTGTRAVERNWILEAGFADIDQPRCSDELVRLSGLPANVIPDVIASHSLLGHVSAEAARQTGLPPGLAVFGGAADHIASALAAGLTSVGDVLLKFGGAGDIIAVTTRPVPDKRLFLDYHLIPGLYAPNGCMASSGSALRWMAELLSGDSADASLQRLDAAAATIAPGSDGVRALPYFLGEKTPIHNPQARGTITGLSLGHGAPHIWRAMLEAIACGYRHHLDVLTDMGQPINRLIVSDGGSRSRVWMQIVADVTGRPLQPLRESVGSAAGAAWVSLVGAGIVAWADIAASVDIADTIVPNADATKLYDGVYADYRALYGALEPFFG
jgi:xylulokinase